MNENDNKYMDTGDFKLEINTDTAPSVQNYYVEITAGVMKELRAYALYDTQHELGALLLGRLYQAKDLSIVRIEAWIEAKYADNRGANITFTHETWNYINDEHDRLYPHLQVVGWFHTHPGFGIFLSSYDLFIHENFFKNNWQVAMLIDPKNNRDGMFAWRDGKLKEVDYAIVGEEKTAAEMVKQEESRPVIVSAGVKPGIMGVLLVIGIITGLLLSYLPAYFNNLNKVNLAEEPYQEREREGDKLPALLERLEKGQAEQTVMTAHIDKQLTILRQNIELLETKINMQQEEYSWVRLIVREGDTLISLMGRLDIDQKYLPKIMEKNYLQNVNLIYPGDQLLLPLHFEVTD